MPGYQTMSGRSTLPAPMIMQFPPFQIEEADYRAGIINVTARSPIGNVIPLKISKDSTGQFTTNFIPDEIGDWTITITSNGRPISGSPFTVRVYDGTKVKVFGIEGGDNGQPVSFTVDTANAGNGKLKVEVTKDGKPIIPNIAQYGKQYKINFSPEGAGVYSIRVFYATVEVPGSPFKVTIVDSSNVTASGEGLHSCLAGKTTSFIVNTGRAILTDGEVTINIISPSGIPTYPTAKPIGAGSYKVSYLPEEVGRYTIHVKYGGKPIFGSPFIVDVFGLNEVAVLSLTKQTVVNKMAILEFDAKDSGTAEPIVKVNDGKVPCDLKKLDGRKYRASFTPRKTGHFYVEVKLYNVEIPGSPFKVKVHDGSRVATSLDGARGILKMPMKFEVNTSPYEGEVKVQVYSPTRKLTLCKVIKVDDQIYNCEFLPTELGNYDVSISFEDHQIEGSPFTVPVSNPSGVLVSMKSRSLVLGQTFHLTADTTKAGPGDLSVRASNVSGPVPMEGSLIANGMYAVSFIPQIPGKYFIEVSFDCLPLPDSPIILTVYDVRNVTISAGNSPLTAVGHSRAIHVNTEHAGNAELQARLTAPGQHSSPLQITGTSQTGYDISFIPRCPGPHKIDVTYGGVVVPHSPITFMAYDSSKIKVIGVCDRVVGKRSTFLIDLNDSGEGELEVVVMSSSGKPIMNDVNALQPGKLEVSFVPIEGGTHFVEVTFNKEIVQGSPFKFKVSDPNKTQVRGDGIETAEVNTPAHFFIVSNDAKVGDFDVQIKGPPKSRQVHPLVSESGHNQLKVEYTTRNVGEYQISIQYLDMPIPNSPFYVKSWDASKVVLSRVGQSHVGVESSFFVEMKDAGDGTVEISIVDPTGQLIPNQVSSKCPGVLEVKYVPLVAGDHNIMIEFNGVKINGTPMQFQVVDPGKVTVKGEGLSTITCNAVACFVISAPDTQMRDVDVHIIGPNGNDVLYNINERGGSYRVDYTPKMAGDYVIDVSVYKTPVKCSPFIAKAFDATKVMIANVSMGNVGEKSEFKIILAEAGEGVCEICITDPNGQLVPNQVASPAPGILDVVYVPSVYGHHKGVVLFNKQNIPGSPFSFMVVDKSKVTCKTNNSGFAPVKKLTSVLIQAPMAEMKDIEVKVIGPKEVEIPCDVCDAGSNSFRVDFTPQVSGDYHVAVKYFNQPIHVCTVKAWDICKVFVSSIEIARVKSENVFNVDVREAGEGKLEISIQNFSNQMIENTITPVSKTPGLYHVSCTPLVTGIHKVYVQFNGENANGSPFQMVVCDPKQATVSGEGLGIVRCNRPTFFEINGPAALLADVHVNIKSPTRKEVKSKVKEKAAGKFLVEYTPEEPGEHLISVKYFDEPIQNSPFISIAWNIGFVKVECIKPGIIGRTNTFHINAGEAGPGNLEVMITCNGQVVKNTARAIQDTGLVEVTYTPVSFEPHLINVKYNGEPVIGSPFVSTVLNGNLARATGPGLGRVKANVPTKFTVIANAVESPADLEVLITSPSGQIVPASISGSHNSGYVVEYIPLEAGQHLLSVKYADMEIKDSPFHPDVFDPTHVVVSCIPVGCINTCVSFKADTSNAGCGRLTASVQGVKTRPIPEISTDCNGVSMISFTPIESGLHHIAIKFNDCDVPGSPFKCSVVDQNKVRVRMDMTGFKPVGKPVQMQLDTEDMSDLPIQSSVVDPDGNPVEIAEQRAGSIHTLQFLPEVVGKYVINIFYGCGLVPGSPFHCLTYDPSQVKIVDLTNNGTMGQDISFLVDTTEAGPGPVDVNITSNGKGVPTKKEKYMDKHKFTFCAKYPSDYLINVHFNKEQVPETPFIYKIINPANNMNLVSGNNNKPVAVGQPVWAAVVPPHDVRICANDCVAEVIGPYNDQLLPSRVSGLSNGNVKVEYTSKICGLHAIRVTYGGQLVPGSPVINNIFDPSLITIEGVKYGEVGRPMVFDIVKNECGNAELLVTVTDPNDIELPISIVDIDNGDRVTYMPEMPGIYKINVTYGGCIVPGCPVRQEIAAYYPATASGDGLFKGLVGKKATFNVDTKKQIGELVVQVQSPNGPVKSDITPEINGNFRVDYVPPEAGTYSVIMTFKKKEIRGPFNPIISDPSQVKVVDSWEFWPQEDHVIVPINQLKTIGFNTEMAGPGEMTATIDPPDGNTCLAPDLIQTEGGYLLKFIPKSFGNYVIRVYYNKLPIKVFPIIAMCNPQTLDLVVDIPPEPNTCCANCTCEKDEKQKEECGMGCNRNGSPYPPPAKDDNSSSEEEDNIIVAQKESKVGRARPGKNVKFNDKLETIDDKKKIENETENKVENLTNAYILDPNLGLIQTQIVPQFLNPQIVGGQLQAVPQIVDSNGFSLAAPQYIFQQPQIEVVPNMAPTAFMSSQDPQIIGGQLQTVPQIVGGQLQAVPQIVDSNYVSLAAPQFILQQPQIEVQNMPSQVQPIVVQEAVQQFENAKPNYPYEVNACKISGNICNVPEIQQPIIYAVETPPPKKETANSSVQTLSIDAVETQTDPEPPQLIPVIYEDYQIELCCPIHQFQPACPTCPTCTRFPPQCMPCPCPEPKTTSSSSVQTVPEQSTGGTQTDDCQPKEVIDVIHMMEPQPMCHPPQPMLILSHPECPPPPCMATSCQTAQTATANDESVVIVPCDPNQPIPQQLTTADGQFVLLPYNSCCPVGGQEVIAPPTEMDLMKARHDEFKNYMSTRVLEPQECFHHIFIEPPPCVPETKKPETESMVELVKLLSEMNRSKEQKEQILIEEPCRIDENMVVLSGPGLSLARCREQACFVIDGKAAGPGVPSAKLIGLKEEIPVDIELVDENLYGCSYVPTVAGAYLLTVCWSGRQVLGSPIKITVLPCCDPKQVTLYTECLKCAQIGQDVSVVADCRRAGCGNLTAHVQGPSKLYNCDVDNRNDGTFEIVFRPVEAGSYTLNVMYDGEHVPESPFQFKVGASPDASKVKVSGEGLKNGILATFNSSFCVDTRGAGPGKLNVKVRGKKGAFQVEMKRDPHRDRVILCKFNPAEVGEYWVNILWSGAHVPGSPFKVIVVDTLQELKALGSGAKQTSSDMFYGSMSSDPGSNLSFGGEDF
ncbi:hypothetical protein HELRODRAFT_192560 [Helobdella robusta]|uniref:Uncharacterized protein n=1 Tax=Helobdella robusta TaxID=6412 RepID=T1FU29_HELRO|nr:hypothetical protein HELRODRAFT_192560 [Helobdella robusta]ESO00645.1 hypothetical protein HELRODRAFT_192560 [Helobdella robusta]